jgi:microcystin-dependent protein
MSEPFLAQILIVPYSFAPEDWAFCNGQLIPINQNLALYSLLLNTFGGNGQTTFALPDLRGRVPVHVGTGPGLASVTLGQKGGAENVTLSENNMPAHNHLASSTQAGATSSRPANQVPSAGGAYAAGSDGTTMNPAFIQDAGSGQPFGTRDPFLGINFIIALDGIYPPQP